LNALYKLWGGAFVDIYVFVDAENLYGMTQEMGIKIDMAKLVGMIENILNGKMKTGYYFMADRFYPVLPNKDELTKEDDVSQIIFAYQKQEGFKRWLSKQGFQIICRKPQITKRDDGSKIFKADCDSMVTSEMTALAMEKIASRENSAFVLVAGDGDYDYTLNKIISMGYDFWIVSSERFLADNILYMLSANKIIYLEKISSQIERKE